MTARVVLLGATGYTGDLVLDALLRRGISPVLAGRDRTALHALTQRSDGLEYVQADVTDPTSVASLVRRGDVLITTVGPFERYGYAVANAAAQAGAHYIDSTGEVGFVQELRRQLHTRAANSDTVILPAFGYDYVPGNLAGALALRQAGGAARSLDIGYFATGPLWHGLSQGTRTTMRDGLHLPSTCWRDRGLVDVRTASGVRAFNIRGRHKNGFLVSGTEVLYLPEACPALDNVNVYNGWFPKLSRSASALSAFAAAASHVPGGRMLVDALTRPVIGHPGGPDATERGRTRTHVVAVASSAAAPLVEVHLEGPSIYSLTGELIAWAAQQIVAGHSQAAGVIGPIEAFGLNALQSGCDEIGLVSV
ncbi:NAD(P)H-binding protein [Mycolicibacterium septicum DSM 44393]|uniref:NAD(P)H-binding protein n=1 Tax=Mycolicibacterium septicum DSM 44393 TaxID=1341646 RepID=A0A7X6MLY8_9MYCO|nr:saccharopine dehydrogenase NADP-binding domain-containing protein [Mycolicibacterium septicum]NKZ10826.1 NAD(P)H-binding protein [Mycolicibacterium septicum DSM 44393]